MPVSPIRPRLATDRDYTDAVRLDALAPPPPADEVDLGPDDAGLVEGLRAIRAQIAQLKTAEDVLVERIKSRLGDATLAKYQGRPLVRWSWTKPRETVDVKALRLDYPEVAAAVTRVGEPGRRFELLEVKE